MPEPAAMALVALVAAGVGFGLGFLAGLSDRRKQAVGKPPRARLYAQLSRSVLSCQACAEEYDHARIRAGQQPSRRELIPNGPSPARRCEICGCMRARYSLRIPLPEPSRGNHHA